MKPAVAKTIGLLSLTGLMLTLLLLCQETGARADSGWPRDDVRSGRRSPGYWSRGQSSSSRPVSTAEISQALYGNSGDSYDDPIVPSDPQSASIEAEGPPGP